MPQSKEVHKEYMRLRREGSQQQGSQSKGSQGLTVKEALKVEGLTNEHPVLKYLIDKPYRAKMEAIIQALNIHKLTPHAILGCGRNALSLNTVGEMLEVTAK